MPIDADDSEKCWCWWFWCCYRWWAIERMIRQQISMWADEYFFLRYCKSFRTDSNLIQNFLFQKYCNFFPNRIGLGSRIFSGLEYVFCFHTESNSVRKILKILLRFVFRTELDSVWKQKTYSRPEKNSEPSQIRFGKKLQYFWKRKCWIKLESVRKDLQYLRKITNLLIWSFPQQLIICISIRIINISISRNHQHQSVSGGRPIVRHYCCLSSFRS